MKKLIDSCWDHTDLNKSLNHFKKWNDEVLSKVDGVASVIELTAAHCFFGLCLSSQLLALRCTEAFLCLAFVLTEIRKRIESDGDTFVFDKPKADLKPYFLREDPNAEWKVEMLNHTFAARYKKIRLIPREDMGKDFRESLDKYDNVVMTDIVEDPTGLNNDSNDPQNISKLNEVYKVCLELHEAFIRSGLYRHEAIELEGKSLKLASFIKYIYISCAKID